VASKYPPGHALLLTPGSAIGLPTLMPLIITGATALMLFSLAGRLTNSWVAWLTWLVWIGAPIVLRFQPSYLSEVTTGMLIVASWSCLVAWRDTRRRVWLIGLALAMGWGAISRPLTMLALAIPIGVVVLRDAYRDRALCRDIAVAVGAGVCIVAVLPLWAAKTTGSWRLTPLEAYRRDYLPFDTYGFAADTSPPRRTLPAPLASAYAYYRRERVLQRPSAIPSVAAERAKHVLSGFFGGIRLPLVLFALAGLAAGGAAARFGGLSALALFVAHLPYAHWAQWTVYYLEAAPALAFATAAGIWYVSRRLLGEHRARWGVVAALLVCVAIAIPVIRRWRQDHLARSALDRSFAAAVARLPRHSIVFVRYTQRSREHISAVANHADLDAAPVWVVHDLGARNDDLRRLAPDRQSFDFEEDQLVRRR
jgi:4-amino-4-deoxy-L-arabinose transferase-like glycosyltransferase